MNQWHRLMGTDTGPSQWVYGPEAAEHAATILIDALGTVVLGARQRPDTSVHWVNVGCDADLTEAKAQLAPKPAAIEPVPPTLAPCVWRRTHGRGACGRWLYGTKGCEESTALVVIDRMGATKRGTRKPIVKNDDIWLHCIRIRNPRTDELTEHQLWGELADLERAPIRRVQAWTVKRLNGRHPPTGRPTPRLRPGRQPRPSVNAPTTGLHRAVQAQ